MPHLKPRDELTSSSDVQQINHFARIITVVKTISIQLWDVNTVVIKSIMEILRIYDWILQQ